MANIVPSVAERLRLLSSYLLTSFDFDFGGIGDRSSPTEVGKMWISRSPIHPKLKSKMDGGVQENT